MPTLLELKPPFINNEWVKYKKAILQDGVELDPIREFEIRQAFFSGFANGCKIMTAEFQNPEDKGHMEQEIKEELKWFSAQNRELSKNLGMKHQRL